MNKLISKLFPLSRIRNIAMFYVLTSANNAWFVAGIWVFFWGRFMTSTQIGISDAITFGLGFLIELSSCGFTPCYATDSLLREYSKITTSQCKQTLKPRLF